MTAQEMAAEYVASGGRDIYCDLVTPGILPVTVVYRSDTIIAFEHTRPSYEYHIVLAPVHHVPSLMSPEATDVAAELWTVALQLLRGLPYADEGARVECNIGAFQASKHLHLHIVAGAALRADARI